MARVTYRSAAFLAIVFGVSASGLWACISEQDLGAIPADRGDSSLPTECPGRPCGALEVCYRGACEPRTTTTSTCVVEFAAMGQDQCPIDALCTRGTPFDRCELQVPCAADGGCELGSLGAVCNDGYLLDKARVCLAGWCVEQADCPEGLKCVLGDNKLGRCSSGKTGSACLSSTDCEQNGCAEARMSGEFGTCH